MFRHAAAILAKKTAIVAITGVTVIGGATLALAVEGDPPSTQEIDCTALENAEHEDCQEPEPVDCTALENAEHEDCQEPEPVDCTALENAEHEDCVEDEAPECDTTLLLDGETCEDEGAEENDAEIDQVEGEHPDNHGKTVSEAAKPGGTCSEHEGSARGHCIAEIARSNGGDGGAEEPTIETAPEEPAAAAAPAEEPEGKPANAGAPADKGQPANAGPPAGKGKG